MTAEKLTAAVRERDGQSAVCYKSEPTAQASDKGGTAAHGILGNSTAFSTLHAHTTFSDGKSTAEEMISSAISKGATEIGISDHSYLLSEDWTITPEIYNDYYSTLVGLREKYKDKIKVYIGIEQDYLSEKFPYELDYLIGSVHAFDIGGRYHSIDLSVGMTKEIVEEIFRGDPYLYAEAYYDSVSDIYNRTHCDIIGHFDLVTKFIEVDPFLDVTNPRYLKARDRALEALLDTPAVFEVNTGAISRGYRTEPYPDASVIKRIAEAGKPLILTSDSHSAETVDFALASTARKLDSLGVPYLTTLAEVKAYCKKINS